MNKLLTMLLLFLCIISWFCSCSSETEKHQNKRNNVINVHEKVKEIEIEDVFIGAVSILFIINDYLLIADPKSFDKQIRIFDKNSFNYITSVGHKGQGPGEIVSIGYIAVNEPENKFYVSDHGKLNIFSYDMDSVLADAAYMPGIKLKFTDKIFPDTYHYINDTLCIGRTIVPTGNYERTMTVRYHSPDDLQFTRSTGLPSYVINRYDSSFSSVGRSFVPNSSQWFMRYFLFDLLRLK